MAILKFDRKTRSIFSDPPPKVITVEDHDGAYNAWAQAKVQNKTLMHFDAHIDFAWITPDPGDLLKQKSLRDLEALHRSVPLWNTARKQVSKQIHIGNYIYQAMNENIVGEFVWIYPNAPDIKKQSAAIHKILKTLQRSNVGSFEFTVDLQTGGFKGTLCGKPFKAFCFSKLSSLIFDESVLIDIDTDFLFVQSLHSPNYPYGDLQYPQPWLTPQAFLEELKRCDLKTDFVTIAYSVEEGYTPLTLKFLGLELKQRFETDGWQTSEKPFESLHQGVRLESSGDTKTAITALEKGLSKAREPEEAAAIYLHLAHCFFEENIKKARDFFRTAVQLDPSYTSRYSHPGPIFDLLGRDKEARYAYRYMLRLDPQNAVYKLYWVEIAARKKKWREVLTRGEIILKSGFTSSQLSLLMGEAFLKTRDYENAWNALATSLHEENFNFAAQLLLKAKTAFKLRKYDEAAACYQELLKHRFQNFIVHWQLSWVHRKRKNHYKANKHLLKAIRVFFLKPWFRFRVWGFLPR